MQAKWVVLVEETLFNKYFRPFLLHLVLEQEIWRSKHLGKDLKAYLKRRPLKKYTPLVRLTSKSLDANIQGMNFTSFSGQIWRREQETYPRTLLALARSILIGMFHVISRSIHRS